MPNYKDQWRPIQYIGILEHLQIDPILHELYFNKNKNVDIKYLKMMTLVCSFDKVHARLIVFFFLYEDALTFFGYLDPLEVLTETQVRALSNLYI